MTMLTLFSAISPLVWFSMPLGLFFIVAWAFQSKRNNIIDRSMEIKTKMQSNEVAAKMLEELNLSIPIVSGDNYTENYYNQNDNKIYLSPTMMGESDYTSIAHAIQTVSEAFLVRTDPIGANIHRQIHIFNAVLFWFSFTAMAFGLMSSSIPMLLVGYACALVLGTIIFISNRREIGRVTKLVYESRICENFTSEEINGILVVLQTLVKKF